MSSLAVMVGKETAERRPKKNAGSSGGGIALQYKSSSGCRVSVVGMAVWLLWCCCPWVLCRC